MLFVYFSHRPVDVHNVYNQVQIQLLMHPDDIDDVPEFDEVFRDDDSEVRFMVPSLGVRIGLCRIYMWTFWEYYGFRW